jgi:hypothetical protein
MPISMKSRSELRAIAVRFVAAVTIFGAATVSILVQISDTAVSNS